MTKIKVRIVSKPHTLLLTVNIVMKTHPKFHNRLVYECIKNCACDCSYKSVAEKWQSSLHINKIKKNNNIKVRVISNPHAHLQTISNTLAKFQKDRVKP